MIVSQVRLDLEIKRGSNQTISITGRLLRPLDQRCFALQQQPFPWLRLGKAEALLVRDSYLLNPQFCKQSLPRSNPSDDPHQRKTNDLWAASSPMSRAMILSQSQNLTLVTPQVLAYSSRGGSISITSNWFGFKDFRSNLEEKMKIQGVINYRITSRCTRLCLTKLRPKTYVSRSVLRYIGGWAVSDMRSFFKRINSLSFGYS